MTTFITLCVAGYLLWIAAYLLYERHERRKRQRESEETLPRKVADAEDILGKSTFSLCHSTPQVPWAKAHFPCATPRHKYLKKRKP